MINEGYSVDEMNFLIDLDNSSRENKPDYQVKKGVIVFSNSKENIKDKVYNISNLKCFIQECCKFEKFEIGKTDGDHSAELTIEVLKLILDDYKGRIQCEDKKLMEEYLLNTNDEFNISKNMLRINNLLLDFDIDNIIKKLDNKEENNTDKWTYVCLQKYYLIVDYIYSNRIKLNLKSDQINEINNYKKKLDNYLSFNYKITLDEVNIHMLDFFKKIKLSDTQDENNTQFLDNFINKLNDVIKKNTLVVYKMDKMKNITEYEINESILNLMFNKYIHFKRIKQEIKAYKNDDTEDIDYSDEILLIIEKLDLIKSYDNFFSHLEKLHNNRLNSFLIENKNFYEAELIRFPGLKDYIINRIFTHLENIGHDNPILKTELKKLNFIKDNQRILKEKVKNSFISEQNKKFMNELIVDKNDYIYDYKYDWQFYDIYDMNYKSFNPISDRYIIDFLTSSMLSNNLIEEGYEDKNDKFISLKLNKMNFSLQISEDSNCNIYDIRLNGLPANNFFFMTESNKNTCIKWELKDMFNSKIIDLKSDIEDINNFFFKYYENNKKGESKEGITKSILNIKNIVLVDDKLKSEDNEKETFVNLNFENFTFAYGEFKEYQQGLLRYLPNIEEFELSKGKIVCQSEIENEIEDENLDQIIDETNIDHLINIKSNDDNEDKIKKEINLDINSVRLVNKSNLKDQILNLSNINISIIQENEDLIIRANDYNQLNETLILTDILDMIGKEEKKVEEKKKQEEIIININEIPNDYIINNDQENDNCKNETNKNNIQNYNEPYEEYYINEKYFKITGAVINSCILIKKSDKKIPVSNQVLLVYTINDRTLEDKKNYIREVRNSEYIKISYEFDLFKNIKNDNKRLRGNECPIIYSLEVLNHEFIRNILDTDEKTSINYSTTKVIITTSDIDILITLIDKIKELNENYKNDNNKKNFIIPGKSYLFEEAKIFFPHYDFGYKDLDLILRSRKSDFDFFEKQLLPVLEKNIMLQNKYLAYEQKINSLKNIFVLTDYLTVFNLDKNIKDSLRDCIQNNLYEEKINNENIVNKVILELVENTRNIKLKIEYKNHQFKDKITEKIKDYKELISFYLLIFKKLDEKNLKFRKRLSEIRELTKKHKALKNEIMIGDLFKILNNLNDQKYQKNIDVLKYKICTNIEQSKLKNRNPSRNESEILDHDLKNYLSINEDQMLKEFILNFVIQHDSFTNKNNYNKIDDFKKRKEIFDKIINWILDRINLVKISTSLYAIVNLIKLFFLNKEIFDVMVELKKLIETNDVIILKAGTGLGKTTLIPIMLHILGYVKIYVTQPRRLPCKMVFKRVCETFDNTITGFITSDNKSNPSADIIYITDGLFKEILLKEYEYKTPFKADVVILDEIHERGINVDICLALLSQILNKNNNKFKLILSSATLDDKIKNMFSNYRVGTLIKSANKQLIEEIEVIKHPVLLTLQLCLNLKRNDQIICFLSNNEEVSHAVNYFKKFHKEAIPLTAQGNISEQEISIKKGQIFISTSIAETSLTFENLKYVVDSGKIKGPKYDYNEKIFKLVESDVTRSNYLQRKGRLGRTGVQGFYYRTFKLDEKKLLVSEIEKLNIIDHYFSLLKKIKDPQKVRELLLSIPVSDEGYLKNIISFIEQEMLKYEIISKKFNGSYEVSDLLKKISIIPFNLNFYTMISFYHGLTKYNCGNQLLMLGALIYKFGINTSKLLKFSSVIKESIECKDGDIMCLIKIMRDVIHIVDIKKDEKKICKLLNISDRAGGFNNLLLKSYKTYKQWFESIRKIDSLKHLLLAEGDWEDIAKALIISYDSNLFISENLFGKKTDIYLREITINKDQQIRGKIDNSSTLFFKIKEQPKSELILALDFFINEAENIDLSKGIISICGTYKFEWYLNSVWKNKKFQFSYLANNNEEVDFLNNYKKFNLKNLNNSKYLLEGNFKEVYENVKEIVKTINRADREIDINDELSKKISTSRIDERQKKTVLKNMENIQKGFIYKIFKRVIFEFENEYDVKIKFNNSNTKIKVLNSSLQHYNDLLSRFKEFLGWFISCHSIINHEDSNEAFKDNIERTKDNMKLIERLDFLTNPNLELFEEKNERMNLDKKSLMKIVARILIIKFNIIVEGGFVRDYVINDEEANDIDAWIPMENNNCSFFSLDNLKEVLDKIGVTFVRNKFRRNNYEHWRYLLTFKKENVIDKNGIPTTIEFDADLINPIAWVCHDKIDLDCNCLYIKNNWGNTIGMKGDLSCLENINFLLNKDTKISLEILIENIRKKQFNILRQSYNIEERKQKLLKRNWKLLDTFKTLFITTKDQSMTEKIDDKYTIDEILKTHFNNGVIDGKQIKNIVIENIFNKPMKLRYEGERKLIKNENEGNENEKLLYHGTTSRGLDIIDSGFKRSFASAGNWGTGLYFASDIRKTLAYANDNNKYRIFLCRVLLGKEIDMGTKTDSSLNACPRNYRSVKGKTNYDEYIVYQESQVLPLLLATFEFA